MHSLHCCGIPDARAILSRRAKELQIEGPPVIGAGKSRRETAIAFAKGGLTRSVHMLFTELVVGTFTRYVAFDFALLYAFFAAFPWVWEKYYEFDLNQTGSTFIGLGVGVIAGLVIIVCFDRWVYQPKVRCAAGCPDKGLSTSKVQPEERLHLAFVGAPLIGFSLFIFGWTAHFRTHWMGPVLAEALFGAGNLLVFLSATLYVLNFYGPRFGASAMAANTLLRYTVGTGK